MRAHLPRQRGRRSLPAEKIESIHIPVLSLLMVPDVAVATACLFP